MSVIGNLGVASGSPHLTIHLDIGKENVPYEKVRMFCIYAPY